MKNTIRVLIIAVVAFVTMSTATEAQYYVQKGDSMYKIAKNNGMSLKQLISLNPQHVDPNKIHVGDYIITMEKAEPQAVLVEYARSLQDVTVYVYGGQLPTRTDCSGWTQAIYKKFGANLPRVSRDQFKVGQPVAFNDLQEADLMFFSTRADHVITHVGIYMGNGFWISNLNSAKSVEVLSSFGAWTQRYFMGGRRVALHV